MPERTPTPSYPIVADRPRNLRFTAAAIARVEEAYDKPISDILEQLQEGAKAGQVRLRLLLELVTAGCQHEDPELTWQKLGDAMNLSDMKSLLQPLVAAIRLAFPEAPEDADPNAQTPVA
jgi:hypothetical protein